MFELMYKHKFEINTTPGTEPGTLVQIAKGVKNVAPAINENLDQTPYLDGNGFSTSEVIGAQLTLAFTADRDYDDAAQNFIFGKMIALGAARHATFTWTEPDGGKFTGDCTIANIAPPSGDAGAKGECSFEIHFNGQPTYTPPAP